MRLNGKELFISDFSFWAPGLCDDIQKWRDWSKGEIQIELSKDAPKLEYTDPLFRRRLSQISKMTVHVVHNLLESTGISPDTKLIFISMRGEIEREFTINRTLINDGMILPAAFSLSVFNTPVALATLAFKMKGGYTTVFPSGNDFSAAFVNAAAPVLAGTEKQLILVYADELVPAEYGNLAPENSFPLAFAAVIKSEESGNSKKVDLDGIPSVPYEFLKVYADFGRT